MSYTFAISACAFIAFLPLIKKKVIVLASIAFISIELPVDGKKELAIDNCLKDVVGPFLCNYSLKNIFYMQRNRFLEFCSEVVER